MKIFGMVTTSASSEYTPHALQSFFNTTPFDSSDRFFLIENDQPKKQWHQAVTVISNSSPKGFAENVNQVMQIARENKSDLYFLNNDLFFTPQWHEQFFTNDEAILSPMSNREVQYTTDVLNTSVEMQLSDILRKEEGLKAITEQHRQKFTGYMQVLVAPFFCVKIPYKVFNTVGLFDESFGKGGAEDYDYCLRAYLEGFSVKYALGSYVIHFGGKSSWSGVEASSEQKQREEKFKKIFRDKWGDELFQILFFDDPNALKERPDLLEEINKGNHRKVIETLRR